MKRPRNAFRAAWAGLIRVFITQTNMKIHAAIAGLVIIAGIWLRLARIEWAVIALTITMVFALEAANTALETIADEVAQGKRAILIRRAKDIAAGTVLIGAIGSVVVGTLIIVIPAIQKIIGYFR